MDESAAVARTRGPNAARPPGRSRGSWAKFVQSRVLSVKKNGVFTGLGGGFAPPLRTRRYWDPRDVSWCFGTALGRRIMHAIAWFAAPLKKKSWRRNQPDDAGQCRRRRNSGCRGRGDTFKRRQKVVCAPCNCLKPVGCRCGGRHTWWFLLVSPASY